MPVKTEFQIKSSDGKSTLHALSVKPDGQLRGTVQIIHGLAEHIGRYAEFMDFLAANGYACYGDDHLGHGRSAADSSQLGDVGSPEAARFLVEDEYALRQLIRRECGETCPCIVLGHSMGSLILRRFLIAHPDAADKAVIMGTGYFSPQKLRQMGMLLKLTRVFHKGDYRSSLLNQLGTGVLNNAFKPNRTSCDWLSANKENVDRYLADPLCGMPGSLNTFITLYTLMSEIVVQENLVKMNKSLPVLLVSGREDAFGDNTKGVAEVRRLFAEAGMKRVEAIYYDGMRHEILQEHDNGRVYQDILAFIERG